jgi:hypothetical protein
MAGVLSFSQYLGGPDNINIEQIFPSTQRTFTYNFSRNITGWTFNVDQQTIVVDTVAFDRNTGAPNFANSTVIGYFPFGQVSTGTYVTNRNDLTGVVAITTPTNMYTGPILPDARKNVPITIVGVTWTDNSSPVNINTHRWAFIQSWEPGVTPGDPAADPGFINIV